MPPIKRQSSGAGHASLPSDGARQVDSPPTGTRRGEASAAPDVSRLRPPLRRPWGRSEAIRCANAGLFRSDAGGLSPFSAPARSAPLPSDVRLGGAVENAAGKRGLPGSRRPQAAGSWRRGAPGPLTRRFIFERDSHVQENDVGLRLPHYSSAFRSGSSRVPSSSASTSGGTELTYLLEPAGSGIASRHRGQGHHLEEARRLRPQRRSTSPFRARTSSWCSSRARTCSRSLGARRTRSRGRGLDLPDWSRASQRTPTGYGSSRRRRRILSPRTGTGSSGRADTTLAEEATSAPRLLVRAEDEKELIGRKPRYTSGSRAHPREPARV
jgi:hypothetical protein